MFNHFWSKTATKVLKNHQRLIGWAAYFDINCLPASSHHERLRCIRLSCIVRWLIGWGALIFKCFFVLPEQFVFSVLNGWAWKQPFFAQSPFNSIHPMALQSLSSLLNRAETVDHLHKLIYDAESSDMNDAGLFSYILSRRVLKIEGCGQQPYLLNDYLIMFHSVPSTYTDIALKCNKRWH